MKLTLDEPQFLQKKNLIIPIHLKQQFYNPDTVTYSFTTDLDEL